MTGAEERIPRTVVHYSKHDPLHHVGGVETFGRNLRLVFEEVEYMTPQNRDFGRVERERLPLICDNHWVRDVPKGRSCHCFSTRVAAVKKRVTKRLDDYRVAWRQRSAARRKNTIWVSNSEWVSRRFREMYGNGGHVIYYQVDLERFDGRLDNEGSRLILHDGRSENKGKKLMQTIAEAAYGDRDALIAKTGEFLRSLDSVTYRPHAWVEAHASRAECIRRWRRVIEAFDALPR